MNNKKKNILITEAYTDANIGSASFIENTAKLIEKYCDNPDIKILAQQKKHVEKFPGVKIFSVFSGGYRLPSSQKVRGIFCSSMVSFLKETFGRVFDKKIVQKLSAILFRVLSHFPCFPPKTKKSFLMEC